MWQVRVAQAPRAGCAGNVIDMFHSTPRRARRPPRAPDLETPARVLVVTLLALHVIIDIFPKR